ncbi:hypothetical protein SAMN02745866_04354 [Alteromonadaceae bacterium Bs31]|nr:hypothetical protein SAMN02745866_04354 [Alteromonadaceae bacterium Bs31]
MINRAALILKYKKPAIEWINDADPLDDDPQISASDVNTERTVYLLREDVADTPELLEEWLKMNVDVLFEKELEGWYSDETLWPENRNYSLFKKWFKVECHTVIEDTVGGPIIDEEF